MEVICSIHVPSPLYYGCPNHTHPSREVGRREDGDIIKHEGFLINPAHVEVKFGENDQSVGSRGLTCLVNKSCVIPYLRSDENVC